MASVELNAPVSGAINILKERKKINLISAAVLVTAFILIFLTPSAYASFYSDFIRKMCSDILNGGSSVILETIQGTGNLGAVYTACTKDLTGLFEGKAAIINTMKGIAALLAVAIAMGHMFENLERGQDQVEAIFKIGIELIVTFLIIMDVEKIMGGLASVGTELAKKFAATSSSTTSQGVDTLLEAITDKKDGSFFWFIGCFVQLAFPWIMSVLITISAKFVIIQIMFEIAVRRAFSPLAVIDVYKEGLRSPGTRYFKKFFAAFVKLMIAGFVCGLLPTLITACAGALSGGISGAFDYMFTVIAVNFAGIAFIMKTGEYANDIVGV